MSAPVRTPIPRGLTTNPDLSLPAAVQRCLRRPLALHVIAGMGRLQTHTLVHLVPDTDEYALAEMDRYDIGNWDRAAARIASDTPHRRDRTKRVTRRRESLRTTLLRFQVPGMSMTAAIETDPEGFFSALLAWLWWAEQVKAGTPPETAWVLLGLRMPTPVLRHFRFDSEAGRLSAVDPSITLFTA